MVRVERPDHEVAIVIGVRPVVVLLVAVALGEAGQVEPVPAPALAVVRAGEQFVDDLLEGVRRGVGDEMRRSAPASAAGRSDRNTRAGSASACPPRRRWREPLLLELREDEAIDRRPAPRLVLHRRRLRIRQRLKRPELPVLIRHLRACRASPFPPPAAFANGAPRSIHCGDFRDRRVRQFVRLLRHFQIRVFVPDRLARAGSPPIFPARSRSPVSPSFSAVLARRQVEAALRPLLPAVAFHAMLREQLRHVAVEKRQRPSPSPRHDRAGPATRQRDNRWRAAVGGNGGSCVQADNPANLATLWLDATAFFCAAAAPTSMPTAASSRTRARGRRADPLSRR